MQGQQFDVDYEYVLDLMGDGKSITETADALGVSAPTLQRYITLHRAEDPVFNREYCKLPNVSRRNSNPRVLENPEVLVRGLDVGKIWALRKAGWSVKDIASDIRTDAKEVEDILSKEPPRYATLMS